MTDADLDAIEKLLSRLEAVQKLGGSEGVWKQLQVLNRIGDAVPVLLARVRTPEG